MNEGGGRLLRSILHRALARYLRVSPKGLHFDSTPTRTALVRILGWGPARTLYENRKPVCRSLDGAASLTHLDRRCDDCPKNRQCTSQVRLDLLVKGRPYRLLLAYTSAKNFLLHEDALHRRRVPVENVEHRIDVIDRGTFGELRFSLPP